MSEHKTWIVKALGLYLVDWDDGAFSSAQRDALRFGDKGAAILSTIGLLNAKVYRLVPKVPS